MESTFGVDIAEGRYILALGILDPANSAPNLRFATAWYFNGGYHPVGVVQVGDGDGGPLPDGQAFDDPHLDNTLNYLR